MGRLRLVAAKLEPAYPRVLAAGVLHLLPKQPLQRTPHHVQDCETVLRQPMAIVGLQNFKDLTFELLQQVAVGVVTWQILECVSEEIFSRLALGSDVGLRSYV